MTWPADGPDFPEILEPAELISDVADLSAGQYELAQTAAEDLLARVRDFWQEVTGFVVDIPWSAIDIDIPIPSFGLDGFDMIPPSAPDLDDMVYVPPVFLGTVPDFESVDISVEDPPPFNVPDPGVDIPGPPTVVWPVLDVGTPVEISVDIPTAPEYSLPPIPAFNDISIPSVPEFNEPAFEGTPPTIDITPPDLTFSWTEPVYSSDMRELLDDRIQSNIVLGGSGLSTEVEQAIYDRATARQESELEQQLLEASSYWASRGFAMPPGILNGMILEARNKMAQTREDLNNDILIKQADLAQKNTHFMFERGVDVERIVTDHTNQIQARSLDAAKFVVTATVQIYQSKVECYKAQAQMYQVYAAVFEARIRAEIARAERYRVMLEGLKLTVDVQLAVVEVYKAQVQATATLIDLYRAEMEGAKVQSSINRDQIESYKARVEAYGEEVRAGTARYVGYETQVKGEVAKVQLYGEQVNAYSATVGAYKARSEIDVARVSMAVEQNKAEVDIYRALVDRYKADIDAAIAEAEIIAKEQGYRVALYDTDVKMFAEEVTAATSIFQGRIQEQRNHMEISIKEADVAVRRAIAETDYRGRIGAANIQAEAQVASANLAQFSNSTHTSNNTSRSDSRAQQHSISESTARSSSWQNNVSVMNWYDHEV